MAAFDKASEQVKDSDRHGGWRQSRDKGAAEKVKLTGEQGPDRPFSGPAPSGAESCDGHQCCCQAQGEGQAKKEERSTADEGLAPNAASEGVCRQGPRSGPKAFGRERSPWQRMTRCLERYLCLHR